MKTLKLPSGAELQITSAPFADAKDLYQAVLEEMKSLKISGMDEIDYNMMKDLFCVGLSSKKIEKAVEKCALRCLYNGSRITDSTWEPIDARGDYLTAMMEVVKENVTPFMKGLFAEFSTLFPKILKDQASRPQTTQA